MVSGRGKSEIGDGVETVPQEWSEAAVVNSIPTPAFIAGWRPIHQLQKIHEGTKLGVRPTERNRCDDHYHHHDGRMRAQSRP